MVIRGYAEAAVRRVDLQAYAEQPPTPVSAEIEPNPVRAAS
ncbi:hypothetical protein [Enemella dayhoffiae]|nr:hypothetical protein [Enemella dayhoffiae]